MQKNTPRRPGEAVFTVFLLLASLFLFWSAYGIAGFEALSSPGAIPMAASAAMIITAAIITVQTFRKPGNSGELLHRQILPLSVLVTVALITVYAFLLKPLGFLPTSFLFLIVAIKFLSRRSLAFTLGTATLSVALIYLVFRLIFSVLMPEGIVPEGEIIAWMRNLSAGGQ